MKRIIDMLLRMIWPAIVLFVLLVAEVLINDTRILTIHKYAEGNSVSDTSILINQEWVEPLIGVTIFAVVLFTALFIAGFIWNIVYSIKHKNENDIEKQ